MWRKFFSYNRELSNRLHARFPGVFAATRNYRREIVAAIEADIARRGHPTVIECGGVDRPLIPKSPDYRYVGLDIEHRPGCDRVYDDFIIRSIEQPIGVAADLVISFTLLEHVRDNEAAIASIYGALRAGGTTYHYIPSKSHPYSLALRAVGPTLQKRLIALLRPAAVEETGYPAFFNRCSPSAMAHLFRQTGFTNISVSPFYRANDYFAFFTPAYVAVSLFENAAHALGLRMFCSGFIVSAERPA